MKLNIHKNYFRKLTPNTNGKIRHGKCLQTLAQIYEILVLLLKLSTCCTWYIVSV